MNEEQNKQAPGFDTPALWLVPAAMCVLALAPLPYGYYTLLRLVVCGTSGLIVYLRVRKNGRVDGWAVAFGVVALLFNPLIPVFLNREIWMVIDLVVAGTFAAYGMLKMRD